MSIVTDFWDRSVMLCVEPISDSVSLNDNLVQSKLWVLATAEHFNIGVGIKECRYKWTRHNATTDTDGYLL